MASSSISVMAANRIRKEALKFREDSEGLSLEVLSDTEWRISLTGAPGTLYAGEDYVLKVTFTSEYPMDSPIVQFVGPSPPHEHIYSNGHICLNILGEDWSPALTVKSVVLSILSMLSSATVRARPDGDDSYSKHAPLNPKKTSFLYHDDSV